MDSKTIEDLEAALPILEQPAANENDATINPEDIANTPHLSLLSIFWLFLRRVGLFAWDDPTAQVTLLRREIVGRQEWATTERFDRVLSVFTLLPGPLMAKLCMFFGHQVGGRMGAVVAGLGFILPGFFIILLASYTYTFAVVGNVYFDAASRGIQLVVAALMMRALYRFIQYGLRNPNGIGINYWLFAYGSLTNFNEELRITWFISFVMFALIHMFISQKRFLPAGGIFVLAYGLITLYLYLYGRPSLPIGIASQPDLTHLFTLGLVYGTFSLGGSLTATPFIHVEAATWMAQPILANIIAITGSLPVPLDLLVAFVGFKGGFDRGGILYALAGSVVITFAMLLPSFFFILTGYDRLVNIICNKNLAAAFDGLCGCMAGVITSFGYALLKSNTNWTGPDTDHRFSNKTQNWISTGLVVVSLVLLSFVQHRYTVLALVLSMASLGQFFFR